MHRDVSQASFAEALVRGGGNARLDRIMGLIDWSRIDGLLEGIYASTTGRPAYPPLVLLISTIDSVPAGSVVGEKVATPPSPLS